MKSGKLKLFVRPGASVENREKMLNAWCRDELKKVIPELLDKWQPVVGKKAAHWGIKELLDQFIPHWRTSQKTLKTSPLAHEEWEY